MSVTGRHCRPCETPRRSRRRRGTVWLCSCGKAWTLALSVFGDWRWEGLSLQAIDSVARHQIDGVHDVLEVLIANEGVEL